MSEQRLHILVCDDDFEIVQAIQIYLERAGYIVQHAYNGKQALEVLEKQPIHLVLLDIMMPLMDGMEALTRIRETRSLPVILVSAKGESNDKIDGLLGGADDYITKPFNAKELVARVKSQLRRYVQYRSYDPRQDLEGIVLRQGTLILNRRKQSVEVDGMPRSLTPLEFSILWLLMEHPGRVYSSEEIYESVWQEDSAGSVATVAVHIRHIREKIEINPREPRYLKVIWGRGYRLEPQSDPKQAEKNTATSNQQSVAPSDSPLDSQEVQDNDTDTDKIEKGGQHE